MKRFKSFSRYAVLIIFLLLTNNLSAQTAYTGTDVMNVDSVEISLLTCDPRQNVYSLYGHTAIRINNHASTPGESYDIAVNYGMFSFEKPFFILRFVFGLTDYEMDIEDFMSFKEHYSAFGCGVRQQTLNLTADEKRAIIKAIAVNAQPENKVYRYNYFYDNCTTRARDILVNSINGKVVYGKMNGSESHPSYRQMIHAHNGQHPWARFGNDMLLGVQADRPTDARQQQFLPDNLRQAFDNAIIVEKNGTKRQLVKRSSWILPHVEHPVESEFPFTPTQCAAMLATIVVAITAMEWFKKNNYWIIDTILLAVTGICGLLLLAMVFSYHPTVKLNFQILLLNPLSLILLYPTIKRLRRRQLYWWVPTYTLLIIAFFICGFFQDYAEGMNIVALCLLLRYLSKTIQLVRNKK